MHLDSLVNPAPKPQKPHKKKTDPERQFETVVQHITRIRLDAGRKTCRFFVFVERNLGFELLPSPPGVSHG